MVNQVFDQECKRALLHFIIWVYQTLADTFFYMWMRYPSRSIKAIFEKKAFFSAQNYN